MLFSSHRRLRGAAQALLSRQMSTTEHAVEIPYKFKGHNISTPPQVAHSTQEELIGYLKKMMTMRRMEINADMKYKARQIRGFCHLYDGQEAIAVGIAAALKENDDLITAYRCHAIALTRGATVTSVMSELFGFRQGQTKGKGGSMHMYSRSHNFWGGSGIVGAQVPIGAGTALAQKYFETVITPNQAYSDAKKAYEADMSAYRLACNQLDASKTPKSPPSPPIRPRLQHKNISIAMYGDGAANQGQIWESANMAALWHLPIIYIIENNKFGMGTASNKSSSNSDYHTMGNKIPGVKADGMHVLAVREAMKFCRNHCASGNGPIYLELETYRYHGHSMADPDVTYRAKEEIQAVRASRDPISVAKKILMEKFNVPENDLTEMENKIKAQVDAEIAAAWDNGKEPEMEELYKDIYTSNAETPASEFPKFVRMPDRMKSRRV